MSHIVVFGGTGYAGGHIAAEAVRRGHTVTSYTRSLPAEPVAGIEYLVGSIHDPVVVKQAASVGDDVVVALHAYDEPLLIDALPELVAASTEHGARLSFVGGAGSSLTHEGGGRLVDGPEFHEEWKPEALSHAEILEALRADESGLDWFYVSPAALFGSYAPGEATGAYRTNGDVWVTRDDGSSEISGADFALAYVDEIEQRRHVNRRFTVGH